MNWPSHGSNPQYLFEALQLTMPEKRIDFSANINPLGPPSSIKAKWQELYHKILDYPDPHGKRLKAMLAQRENISHHQILIGNGGAELISLIGRMLSGKRILIVQPAFSEYEEVCRINGCTIEYHQLIPPRWELNAEELKEKLTHVDAVFLCNPSNPTGIYYSQSVVLDVLRECHRQNCLFIVDEAFYDFLIDYKSIVSYINHYPNLLIIRSMTKMFAIPGLRLGYVMANEKIINKLAGYQPHWSINALALQTGEWCLESEEYLNESRRFIKSERDKLIYFYWQKGFIVSPSCVNFYLIQDPFIDDPLSLFQFLLIRGIIPRHTMNFPGLQGEWLRLAVKGQKENEVLMEAMTEWRNRP